MRVQCGHSASRRSGRALVAALISATFISTAVWLALGQNSLPADAPASTSTGNTPAAEVSVSAKPAPVLTRPSFSQTIAVPAKPAEGVRQLPVPVIPVVRAPEPAPGSVPGPTLSPTEARRPTGERVILRTVAGDMVLGCYPEVAPDTVRQILKLTRLGVFDTMHFGAMQRGFYLQLYNPEERLISMSEEAEKALVPIKGELSK
jgi:hypothetical protein